ncbi:MAG: HEAT repeat domain-containing protein [Candidatus Brocadiia bacterium]
MRILLTSFSLAVAAFAVLGCGEEEAWEPRGAGSGAENGDAAERLPFRDDELEDTLLNSDGHQKAKIRELARRGVPELKSLVRKGEPVLRCAAILALGQIEDDERATRLLVRLCDGPDAEQAHWALIALAQSGACEAKALVQRFAGAGSPRRREAACIAVYELGDAALYPLLDRASADPHRGVRMVAETMGRRLILEGREP